MIFYTHSGLFHADEVMAFAIACMAGKTTSTDLRRLTKIDNIPEDGIVADIGREWIPSQMKFDHHQGFFLRENGFPLASAGMMWREFGREVVSHRISDPAIIDDVCRRVDEILIQGIDAHDADSSYSVAARCSAGDVRALTLSNVISSFNSEDVHDHSEQRYQFKKASIFCENLIGKAIADSEKYIQAKKNFNPEVLLYGRLLVLEEGCPWKEIVDEDYPDALYVIAPSNHPGSPFSMIAVPVEPSSREVKKPIERPDWFDGFIHQGKWIAGGKSVEELTRLAIYSATGKK